jgi:site-specific recombinase XerD
LSEKSIYDCWRFADRFLNFRFKGRRPDLSKITPADIARFMQHLISRGKPFRDKTPPTHLRNFFQFLFRSGRTNVNLAPSVPRIAHRYASRLPRHLTWEQVEVAIAAVKADTAIGRRNYAMVLLMARLGLRAAEVIAIQIDDINWRAGELLIRGKGQLHDRLPLPKDVGEALANYIRQDRVTTSRALFVWHRVPHMPFVDSQVISEVMKKAFERANLNPPTRYVGSHILRGSRQRRDAGPPFATFGDAVANIVVDCTDAWTEPKPPWRARKEAYLHLHALPGSRNLLSWSYWPTRRTTRKRSCSTIASWVTNSGIGSTTAPMGLAGTTPRSLAVLHKQCRGACPTASRALSSHSQDHHSRTNKT